jgi:hypothetical protein
MVMDRSTLHTGDRVVVSWGLGTIEAEVEEVYGTAPHVHVLLTVPVLGPSGEALDHHTVSLPLWAIQRVLV